jgi:hypothetical protein
MQPDLLTDLVQLEHRATAKLAAFPVSAADGCAVNVPSAISYQDALRAGAIVAVKRVQHLELLRLRQNQCRGEQEH